MKVFLIHLLIWGTALGIIFGWMILSRENDKEVWNHGICSSCRIGHYEFVNKSADRYNTYYYKCNNCDSVIEIHFLAK